MSHCFDNDFVCANEYLKVDDYSAAIVVYKSILSVQPDNVRALHALGVATFRGFSDARRAVRLIRHALTLKKDFSDAYNSLAKILQERHRIRAAIACYRQAVSILPNNLIAWINLGLLYSREKKTARGHRFFSRCHQICPR